ncbi:MAG: hypothetical protein ETSY1_09545 [Candidatus Entotheonella factor]|uniref:DUF86 domain-containing protein n=1 Tax=Entotheonella factor TaxID=1429438 RepID=W4LSD9_ENTF1|nr:DUF86 domain-containing protein [Candidatus Entotheonella palauensis]ETX00883.1 MAG: hypothetical protein ETSY1_09545 [Candidatus Entotheonella factor]
MIDRERILSRIDHLQQYLRDLSTIVPPTFEAYQGVEKRRACERLLQLAIEAMTDICGILVAGSRLGLPAEALDMFEKLREAAVITPETVTTLRRMRGFRNILVHEYTQVDDQIVYHIASERLGDFEVFIREVLEHLADP